MPHAKLQSDEKIPPQRGIDTPPDLPDGFPTPRRIGLLTRKSFADDLPVRAGATRRNNPQADGGGQVCDPPGFDKADCRDSVLPGQTKNSYVLLFPVVTTSASGRLHTDACGDDRQSSPAPRRRGVGTRPLGPLRRTRTSVSTLDETRFGQGDAAAGDARSSAGAP